MQQTRGPLYSQGKRGTVQERIKVDVKRKKKKRYKPNKPRNRSGKKKVIRVRKKKVERAEQKLPMVSGVARHSTR